MNWLASLDTPVRETDPLSCPSEAIKETMVWSFASESEQTFTDLPYKRAPECLYLSNVHKTTQENSHTHLWKLGALTTASWSTSAVLTQTYGSKMAGNEVKSSQTETLNWAWLAQTHRGETKFSLTHQESQQKSVFWEFVLPFWRVVQTKEGGCFLHRCFSCNF